MLYMIVEYFKNGDAKPIYKRFREKGRLAPEGLKYISSWVDLDLQRCFQLMETNDEKLIQKWIEHWDDIVDFEVFPVMDSKDAVEKMSKILEM